MYHNGRKVDRWSKKCCKCFHCKSNTKKGKCNSLTPPISTEQAKSNPLIRSHSEPQINP